MGRKNTGCIRVRGEFQYRASITLDGCEKSKTCLTEQEAREWLDGLISAHVSGAAVEWLAGRDLTLGAALERYLAEITLDKKSAAEERRRISAFLKRELDLCKIRLHDVKVTQIKQLIKRRTKPQVPGVKAITGSTMNRELAFISHVFTVASSEWEIEGLVNPIDEGIRCPENKGRNRRLEEGEEDTIRAAARAYARDNQPDISIEALFDCAVDTAMRLGELGNIYWKHVNLREGTILLPDSKNGEARTVPLWPRTIRLLASLPRRDDGRVFGPKESIRLMWTRVMKRTGIKGLRFHDLRHEAISRFFERTDLTDMEIASISGHKTLTMLKRYAHLRANKLAKKLAACEARQPLMLVA